jgi:hypothetical protein
VKPTIILEFQSLGNTIELFLILFPTLLGLDPDDKCPRREAL